MSENLLDKLDAQHDGAARRYLASLYAFGASHEQAAEKLAEQFGIRQPTKRSTGEWRRNDPQLRKMVEQLEAARADLAPDAPPADVLANVPAPVDPAEAVMDLFTLLDDHPAFADLSARCDLDPDFPDDVAREVLLEDHADDEAFEAACRERLGDWNVHVALGADPADVERVERSMAERMTAA